MGDTSRDGCGGGGRVEAGALVGREGEYGRIVDFLLSRRGPSCGSDEESRPSTGASTLLVSGPCGAGKSSTVQRAINAARSLGTGATMTYLNCAGLTHHEFMDTLVQTSPHGLRSMLEHLRRSTAASRRKQQPAPPLAASPRAHCVVLDEADCIDTPAWRTSVGQLCRLAVTFPHLLKLLCVSNDHEPQCLPSTAIGERIVFTAYTARTIASILHTTAPQVHHTAAEATAKATALHYVGDMRKANQVVQRATDDLNRRKRYRDSNPSTVDARHAEPPSASCNTSAVVTTRDVLHVLRSAESERLDMILIALPEQALIVLCCVLHQWMTVPHAHTGAQPLFSDRTNEITQQHLRRTIPHGKGAPQPAVVLLTSQCVFRTYKAFMTRFSFPALSLGSVEDALGSLIDYGILLKTSMSTPPNTGPCSAVSRRQPSSIVEVRYCVNTALGGSVSVLLNALRTLAKTVNDGEASLPPRAQQFVVEML